MSDLVKKRTLALVSEIDPCELAVRIAEAFSEMKRPEGATAREAFDGMDDEIGKAYFRAARVAVEYIAECINAGRKPS